MFLGTYHSKLYGKSEYDTIAVEDTYNLLISNKYIEKGEILPIEKENMSQICDLAKRCLLDDKTVLRIKPHVHVIGDLRGNYNHIWDMITTNETTDQFLFLGDYVNYGKNSIEVITLALCMKLIAPNQVFLLRGCQETEEMTKLHGFRDECIDRFGEEIYNQFLDVFECMPLAAIATDIEKTKSILFMNGGISPNLKKIEQLDEIERPITNVESGIVHDILFSDPISDNKKNNSSNDNGNTYGKNAVHRFLKNNHLDQIIRSHQYQYNGYSYPFGEFDDPCVLTIFSAPGYDNGKSHINTGAHLYLRDSMLYTIAKISGAPDEKNNNAVRV
ncbi:hypothetical protein M9Y10_001210 [Tritrichomonas musculus]|uniref:protein-serine/threonine phosphatase n=1 Tax=Tritrichomonas musculus TaxID=1915356 RepID=A0ABR2L6H6_9EUKA